MVEKKNWFVRHWFLTILLIVLLLGILGSIIGQDKNPGKASSLNSQESVLASKTSGYTLDECLAVCDSYCIQSQVDVCQSSCYMVGKEGKSLDKVVSSIKNATLDLEC